MGILKGGVHIFGTHKLTGRVEKLEDDLRALRSDMQRATLDYLDLYAKAKKIFGRVVKAQARQEAEEEETARQMPLPGVEGQPLSARAQLIQKQIMQRRNAMGIRPNGGE